jgi:hypothetical protein
MTDNNNFDFLVGTWTSTQRRRREVLAGCDEWYEFPATLRCWSVFGGRGNVDEADFPTLGFSGVTLRVYDPDTDLWSLYWVNSRTGLALPPNVGRFDSSGEGVFLCDDVYQGREIVCRYRWYDIAPDSARWEQAFSVDGGATWEVNWHMRWLRDPAPR